ncbi:MAG TPA: ABC-three component system middle component 5 [Pseudomonas sp.]|uniref:ABC-three component system middle component 5 n=1 Tax=Pseudomonas sp. TaxID=306 RepID=UPI002B49999D|nr:ABC-three component system middle component 5 [Pseudomonas sp.]HKS13053.1 ABC-three component system middle component 5 [Pseudomonas sp.]
MLIYHPAADANHCCYRLVNILRSIDGDDLSMSMLRLLDFYYLYPHLLKKINPLPRPINRRSSYIMKLADPFEITTSPQLLFHELSLIQDSAVRSLAEKGLIQVNSDDVRLIIENVPVELISYCEADEFSRSDAFDIVTNYVSKSVLNGKNGLKARSGLMEYRYD